MFNFCESWKKFFIKYICSSTWYQSNTYEYTKLKLNFTLALYRGRGINFKTMKKYKISFEGEVLELWKYWLIFRVPKRRKKSRIENKTNTDAKMYSEVFKPQSAKSIDFLKRFKRVQKSKLMPFLYYKQQKWRLTP